MDDALKVFDSWSESFPPPNECRAEQPAEERRAEQRALLDESYKARPAEERSADQHALADESVDTCPHVAAILDSIHVNVLEWITKEFHWNKLSHYGCSDDGTIRRHDTITYTAVEKLEHLLKESKERRGWYCANPEEDILTDSRF